MAVFPEFGKSQIDPNTLEKIRTTRQLIEDSNPKILLAVDGDIRAENIRSVVDAGANFIAMGAALFGTDNYSKSIKRSRITATLI